MVRAVLRNGVIVPLDPLPAGWSDGRELRVKEAEEPEDSPEAIDQWYQELQAAAAQQDPEDDERLRAAVAEIRRQAKEQARREMGLP